VEGDSPLVYGHDSHHPVVLPVPYSQLPEAPAPVLATPPPSSSPATLPLLPIELLLIVLVLLLLLMVVLAVVVGWEGGREGWGHTQRYIFVPNL